nr:MlaD family protein [Endozoicomonas sp.]
MDQENNHSRADGTGGSKPPATAVKAAEIEDRFNFTPIWLLPILVLVAVGWLLWQELDHGGVEIMISFDNGRGITVGKTEVLHNGIPVGHVIRLSPSNDFDAVNITVKMHQRFQTLLTENSAFWLVEPQLSLTEISGLDTLITGNYIAFSPSSEGSLKSSFTALKRAPAMMGGKDGIRLTLRSDELPSLEIGSPVFYRKLKVGEVFSYGLSEGGQFVETQIYIQSEFTHLVHKNTRFWSAGGLKVSANMTNLEVQAQSLVSILKGGIAFYTPEWEKESPLVSNGAEFSLYSDYDTAEAGIPITIEFPLGVSLGDNNVPIRFHGQEVGRIRSVDVSEDVTRVIAEAIIKPEVKPALVAGTRFWIVEPKLGLDGVSDLDTLISGRYVAMDINKRVVAAAGSSVSHFKGMATRPATPIGAIGLSLNLETDALKGIDIGSPVLYRNVPVGFVQSYELKDSGLSIHVLIEA